jgi:hypothetical protein
MSSPTSTVTVQTSSDLTPVTDLVPESESPTGTKETSLKLGRFPRRELHWYIVPTGIAVASAKRFQAIPERRSLATLSLTLRGHGRLLPGTSARYCAQIWRTSSSNSSAFSCSIQTEITSVGPKGKDAACAQRTQFRVYLAVEEVLVHWVEEIVPGGARVSSP